MPHTAMRYSTEKMHKVLKMQGDGEINRIHTKDLKGA